MDKRSGRRPDRHSDQKSRRPQGRRSEFGTFEDVAHRAKAEREAKQQQQKNDGKTRCAYCGGHMKPRGAVGHAGHIRSKCRKCGRTVWTRPPFKPPVPLVPTSKLDGLGGMNVHMRGMRERVRPRSDDQGAGGQ